LAVKLRLKRFGKKKKPFFRLVAAHGSTPRDGKSLELLGVYDPQKDPVLFECKADRIQHWISVGATPSDTVARLLGNAGIIEKPKKTSSNLGNTKQKRREIAENGGIDPAIEEAAKAKEEAAKAKADAAEAAKAAKAEEKASEVKEEAPKAEEKAPEVKEEAPKAEEKAPEVKEEAPKAEEKAPEVKAAAPKAEEKAPETAEKAKSE
jgi:small subunit ribosomal protein S16